MYTIELIDDSFLFLIETISALKKRGALTLVALYRKNSWGKLTHFHARPEIKDTAEPRKGIGLWHFVALNVPKNNTKALVLML
ncbi:MAG: hypothetical protein JSV96_11195 [Candidatus Aminicenantes bacterium]|nr:MAG: hypothetical protein JSV96_11195 [Candidatus Aminicenantes bacterium]